MDRVYLAIWEVVSKQEANKVLVNLEDLVYFQIPALVSKAVAAVDLAVCFREVKLEGNLLANKEQSSKEVDYFLMFPVVVVQQEVRLPCWVEVDKHQANKHLVNKQEHNKEDRRRDSKPEEVACFLIFPVAVVVQQEVRLPCWVEVDKHQASKHLANRQEHNKEDRHRDNKQQELNKVEEVDFSQTKQEVALNNLDNKQGSNPVVEAVVVWEAFSQTKQEVELNKLPNNLPNSLLVEQVEQAEQEDQEEQ